MLSRTFLTEPRFTGMRGKKCMSVSRGRREDSSSSPAGVGVSHQTRKYAFVGTTHPACDWLRPTHGLRNELYLISYMAFHPTDVRKENRGFEPLRGASLEQDPL